jgi:hypothetical protein
MKADEGAAHYPRYMCARARERANKKCLHLPSSAALAGMSCPPSNKPATELKNRKQIPWHPAFPKLFNPKG